MKQVLIVEDELILRQGIMSLINWAELGCEIVADCTDGNEAIKFLKNNQVDIVITDIKMPGVDGLQLSKYIKENSPLTQILLLTAYSSFEYAQTAIKIGVFDYVVKTSFIRELPKAITRVIEHIEKSKRNIIHQNEEIMKSLVFSGILEGSVSSQEEILQLVANYNINLNNYCIVICEPILNKTPSKSEAMQSFKKFHDLAFQEFNFFSVWIQNTFLMNIVFFLNENDEETMTTVENTCANFLVAAEHILPFDFKISQSNCHKKPQELVLAYQEALSCINQTINEKSFMRYLYHEKAEKAINKADPNASTDTLIKYLSRNKVDEACDYIRNLFSQYSSSEQNLEKIKVDMLLLVSILFSRFGDDDLNLENADLIEQNYNCKLLACRSVNSLFTTMCSMIKEIASMDIQTTANGNYLVQLVNSIIREQYNSSIKLEDMANMLHVNSSYLSRLYKKETGTSVITTLNRYRINKAKDLLKSGEYKISEVAAMVGIDDPAYFTNVFTKYTGSSPKNYRG